MNTVTFPDAERINDEAFLLCGVLPYTFEHGPHGVRIVRNEAAHRTFTAALYGARS